MSGLLLRTIIAVVVFVLCFALIPPLFRVIGVPLTPDVWLIMRVCIAGLALLYIVFGRHTPQLP